MNASRPPVAAEPIAPAPKRPLTEALDIGHYASGTAGEAWALMPRMLFMHGKPRLPAIARELDLPPGRGSRSGSSTSRADG